MAKKTKKKTRKRRPKTTEWSQGQPLAFPKKNPADINLVTRSVVEATIGEPIKPRNPKKKTQQSNRVWIIRKDDFQNALDIIEHAIGEPLVPPKRTARDSLKTTRQPIKKRK